MRTNKETDQKGISLSREIGDECLRYQRIRNLVRRSLQKSHRDRRDIQRVARLLEEFRDEVAMHFALEVASDSFQDAIDAVPRLVPKLNSLLEEQESLYTEACEIADLLQLHREAGNHRVPETIVQRWKKFNQKLKEHDAAERELILDEYFQDIGSVD